MRRLDEAFRSVRREDFLPPNQKGLAHLDQALFIGWGQTNSQPSTVRDMLALLDVHPGQRVLDVGCGSGWTTALLGALVGPTGAVHGVEIVPQLVRFGADNLRGYAMPWTGITEAAPDVLGLPGQAPFDRILVSADASEVPHELVEQLAVGGVMVVPVRGRMTRVRRTDGEPEVSHHGWYAFVRLVEPR